MSNDEEIILGTALASRRLIAYILNDLTESEAFPRDWVIQLLQKVETSFTSDAKPHMTSAPSMAMAELEAAKSVQVVRAEFIKLNPHL